MCGCVCECARAHGCGCVAIVRGEDGRVMGNSTPVRVWRRRRVDGICRTAVFSCALQPCIFHADRFRHRPDPRPRPRLLDDPGNFRPKKLDALDDSDSLIARFVG